MEVYRYTYIYEHNVQVGSMIRAENKRLTWLGLEIAVNFIENECRPEDKMSPDLFQFKNHGEPFFSKQQNGKKREEYKKGDDGICEIK